MWLEAVQRDSARRSYGAVEAGTGVTVMVIRFRHVSSRWTRVLENTYR
jgi:hypothetical protein